MRVELSLPLRWYERDAVFRNHNAEERYSSAKGGKKPSILIGQWSKTLADSQSSARPSQSKSQSMQSGLLLSTLWIFKTGVLSHSWGRRVKSDVSRIPWHQRKIASLKWVFLFFGCRPQPTNALQMSQRSSLFVSRMTMFVRCSGLLFASR